MKSIILLTLVLSFLSWNAFSQTMVHLSPELENTQNVDFIPRSNGLALNADYEDVKMLRVVIEKTLALGKPLEFFTGWDHGYSKYQT